VGLSTAPLFVFFAVVSHLSFDGFVKISWKVGKTRARVNEANANLGKKFVSQ